MHGDFEKYPKLERLVDNTESQDDGLPCGMLQMKDGVAACKIELLHGKEAKPEVCRDYPALSCVQFSPLLIEKGSLLFGKRMKENKVKGALFNLIKNKKVWRNCSGRSIIGLWQTGKYNLFVKKAFW